jgi:hypothetical protein
MTEVVFRPGFAIPKTSVPNARNRLPYKVFACIRKFEFSVSPAQDYQPRVRA